MKQQTHAPLPDIARLTELARDNRSLAGLEQAGEPAKARETLCRALQCRELPTRILAADALAEVGDRTCVAALLSALHDPDALVRSTVHRALERINEKDGDALAAYLLDPDETVRVAAAEALGDLHCLQSIPQLCAALGDPSPEVVVRVAETLRGFKAPDAVAPLCRALLRSGRSLPEFVYGRQDATWTYEERKQVERQGRALEAMVRAVTEIGTPYAAGTLCELVDESFWREVAVAAAEGLEQLLPGLSPEQLAAAIRVLKNQLPPWTFEVKERRETFRRVLLAAQVRHRELRSLPLPTRQSPNSSAQLPRPARGSVDLADAFPTPASPGKSDTREL